MRRALLADPARRRRAHQLAGDDRAYTWSRAQARQLWWSFARRHWRLLTGMATSAAVVTAGAAALMPGTFLTGFTARAGLTATWPRSRY